MNDKHIDAVIRLACQAALAWGLGMTSSSRQLLEDHDLPIPADFHSRVSRISEEVVAEHKRMMEEV